MQLKQMILDYKISVFLLIVFFGSSFVSHGQEIRIDHVISVVSNLEQGIDSFSSKGFSVTKGKLHSNGLINAHIKFDNNSSLELMSIEGDATDLMAEEYKSLLKNGEGGVYLALSGLKHDSIESILTKLNINYIVSKGKLWSYITFPKSSDLAHVFFIDYHFDQTHSKDIFIHKNGLEKINSIFIEGNESVIEFFKNIGLKYSGKINDYEFGIGTEFLTKTGDIIVIPTGESNHRPRIKSIAFGKKDNTKTLRITLK
jgi:hypothetical protein